MELNPKNMTCINCCCTVTNMEKNTTENLPLFLTSVFGSVLHSNSTDLNNITICNNCNSCARKLWNDRNKFLKQTNSESKINRITERGGKGTQFLELDKNTEGPKVVNEEFITCDSGVLCQSDKVIAPKTESNCDGQNTSQQTVKREVVENGQDTYQEKILELKIQRVDLSEFCQESLPSISFQSCQNCSRNFPSHEKLQSHLRSAHTNMEFNFSCHFCEKSFRYYWFYKDHLNVNHCGIEMTFSCSICRKNVHSQKELDKHNFLAHQITTHPFKCNFCDVAYETVEEMEKLRSHLIECHGGTKEAEAARVNMDYKVKKQSWIKMKTVKLKPCDICGKYIKDGLARIVHILFEHQDHRSCQTCQEVFGSEREFSDHIQSSGHPLDSCAVCGKRLRNHLTLLRHWKNTHVDKCFRFNCEMCGSSFYDFDHLRCHYKYHSAKASPRQFSCNQCGKLFILKQQFKNHMALHSVKSDAAEYIKCKYCEKILKGDINLKKHIAQCHTKDLQNETSLAFKCLERECGLRFSSSRSLHLHRRRHTYDYSDSSRIIKTGIADESSESLIKQVIKDGVRKFQCGLCENVLSRIDHLRRHLLHLHKVKLGSYKYDACETVKCEVCGKIVRDKYKLKNHMAAVHKGNHVSVFKNYLHEYPCPLCDTICIAIIGFRDHFLACHPDTQQATTAAHNIKRLKEDIALGLLKSPWKLVKNDSTTKLENFCMTCNNLFPTVSDKYAHDNQIHKALLPCKICKKEFGSQDLLKKHQSTHSALNCHHCESVFDDVEQYYDHLQIKHTLQPFICEFCGQCFSTNTKIRIHCRVNHSNQSVKGSSKSKTGTRKKLAQKNKQKSQPTRGSTRCSSRIVRKKHIADDGTDSDAFFSEYSS